jgi:hypothetical protein
MRSLIIVAALFAAAPAVAQDFNPMEFADTNSDGKVSLDEYQNFSAQGWNFMGQGADKLKPASLDPMMQAAFRGVTVDAEGYVTKDAYLGSVPTRFKAADKNADNALDSAELMATFQPAQ